MEETTSPSYKQCLGKKASVLKSEVLNQLRVKKKKKRKKNKHPWYKNLQLDSL